MDLNNRAKSGLILGALVIAIAVGLIVKTVGDYGWIAFLAGVLMVFGAIFAVIGGTFKGKDSGFGPSEGMYRIVGGIFMFDIGLALFLGGCTDLGNLIVIGVFLLVLAIAGMAVILVNSSKEGKK